MVAIFTGLGSGFERGSAASVGASGLLGNGVQGRGGEQVSVNAANGNLLITRRDEFLVGLGQDVDISRIYNSNAQSNLDENSDHWRQSTDRRVYDVIGTVNGIGSTIMRVAADGTEIQHTYRELDGIQAYWTTDGRGAHDRLDYNTGGSWTWTDGTTGVQETYAETYDVGIRISSETDRDGNTVSYTYDPNDATKLIKIQTSDGGFIEYGWSGNNITTVKTTSVDSLSNTQTFTRVGYRYDAYDRLVQVVTDLDLSDPQSIQGGAATQDRMNLGYPQYFTNYTYVDATSNLIATITQSDESSLTMTYDGNGRVTSLSQGVDGTNVRVTTLAYDQTDELGRAFTRVTDPSGGDTDLIHDQQNRLIEIRSPEPLAERGRPITTFSYDADGNVVEVIDARGERIGYDYDSRGNRTRITDQNGNVTYRQFDDDNNLIIETRSGEVGQNLLQGGDLSQGDAIFSNFTGYDTVYSSNSKAYSQGIQTVDGADSFVISTNGYYEYDGATGSRLASSHTVSGGDLDGGTAFTVHGGEMVTVGFEAKRLLGKPSSYAHMLVRFWDETSTQVGAKYIYAYDVADWERAAAAMEVPEGAVKAKLYLYTYGRQADTGESEPDYTEFAVRNFQFTRGAISAENVVSAASRLAAGTPDFLFDVYEYGASGTVIIQTVDGEPALVFDDSGSTGSGTSFRGSQHSINGGDLDNGESFSVQEGDVISLGLEAKALDTGGGHAKVGSAVLAVHFYDEAGNYISYSNAYSTDLTDGNGQGIWKFAAGNVVAPEGAQKYKVYITHFNRLGVAGGNHDRSIIAVRDLSVQNLGQITDIDAYTPGQNLLPGGDLSQGVSLFSNFPGNTIYFYEGPLAYSATIEAVDGQDAFVITTNAYNHVANGKRQASTHKFLTGDLDNGASYTVEAGEVITVGFEAKNLTSGTSNPSAYSQMFVDFLDASGNRVGYEYIDANDATDWTRGVEKMFVPEGAVKLSLYIYTYGRDQGTLEAEPDVTSFALRNFQFSRDAVTSVNALSAAAQLTGTDFLINSYDPGAVRTAYVSDITVYGETDTALIFDNLDATGSGSVWTASSHGVSGGDLDNGESYSVAPGETLSLSIDVTNIYAVSPSAAGASAGLYVYFYDDAGNTLSGGGTYPIDLFNATGNSIWKSSGRSVVAPEGAVKYKVFIQHFGRLYVGSGDPGRTVVAVRDFQVLNLGHLPAYSAPEGDPNEWGIAHTRYIYDAESHLRYAISADGSVTEYEYTGAGLLKYEKTYLDSAFTDNSATHPTESEMDAWAFQKKYAVVLNYYDARGNLTHEYDFATLEGVGPTGLISSNDGYSNTEYTYDSAGRVLTRSLESGGTDTYVYDGMGRMIASYNPQSGNTNIVFDDFSTRTIVMTSGSHVTTSTYNKAGDLVAETDSVSLPLERMVYDHDEAGRLRTMHEVTGLGTSHKTYYLYDDLGRQTAVVQDDGSIAETRYDRNDRIIATAQYYYKASSGNLSQLLDPNHTLSVEDLRPPLHSSDIWNWMVYDGRGQVVQSINGDGSTTHFSYDYAGRQVGTKNFYNTLVTTSFWDSPPLFVVTPDAHAKDAEVRTFYDRDGRVVGSLNAEGYLTQNIYNAAGQPVQTIAYANDTNAALRESGTFSELLGSITPDSAKDLSARQVYDGMDQLRYEIDADGYVTEFKYALPGVRVTGVVRQIVQHAQALGALVDYGFETVRDAVSAFGVGNADARYSHNVYNDQNQLTFAIDAVGGVTGYIYDVDGRVVRTTQYAAPYLTGSNTPTHTTLAAWASAANSANRTSHSYYNSRGERRAMVDAEGYLTYWQHDQMGRTTSETRYDKTLYEIMGLIPGHDLQTVTTTGLINSLTGISSLDYVITTFAYDSVGRMVQITEDDGTVETISYYAFGLKSESIQADGLAESVRTTFRYDQSGRLITKAHFSDETNGSYSYNRYYYDGLGNRNYEYLRYYSPADPVASNSYGTQPTYLTHDRNGRVATRQLAAGSFVPQTETFEYDAFGNLVRLTDGRGEAAYSYYDNQGRLAATVDAEDYLTEYTYNSFDEVTTEIRRHSRVTGTINAATMPSVAAHSLDTKTEYTYDRLGRVDTVTRWADATTAYVTDTDYTVFGEVDQIADDGEITEYAYDKLGQLIDITSDAVTVDGSSATYWQSYSYDAHGNRLTETNRERGVTTYTYDHAGRVLTKEEPVSPDGTSANIKTLFTYDGRGNLITKTEAAYTPVERVTTYAYDSYDRLISTTHESVNVIESPTGALSTHTPVETITYDVLGNVSMTRDAEGAETFFYYDELNRLTHEVSAVGTLTQHTYDDGDNIIETRVYATEVALPAQPGKTAPSPVNAADYRATYFSYDGLGRMLTSEVRSIQTLAFDGTALTEATGHLTTQYEYDSLGNVVKVIDPNGSTTLSYYDALGRKTAQLDAGSYLTEWSYDGDGNVTQEIRYATTVSGAPTVATKPVGIVDAASDRITTYVYDELGRRVSETRKSVAIASWDGVTFSQGTQDVTIQFVYNALNQVTKRTEATGDVVHYDYDVAGRLTSERREGNGLAYGYVNHDTLAVTPKVSYAYDGLGNVILTKAWGDGSAPDRTTTNIHDDAGRLLSTTDAEGFVRTYRFDAAGRVMREEYSRTHPDGTTVHEGVGYTYDASGRITRQTQLTSANGVHWTEAENTENETVFNTFGEVVTQKLNNVVIAENSYDAAGRLWKTTAGDGIIKVFAHDANGNQSLSITSNGHDMTAVGASLSTQALSDFLALWTGGTATITTTDASVEVNATITQYDARNMAVAVQEPQREVYIDTPPVVATAPVIAPTNLTSTRSYNAFGDVSSETDARGFTLDYLYNTMGRRTLVTNPQTTVWAEDGTMSEFRTTEASHYDVSGRLVAQGDASGHLTHYEYLAGTGYDGAQGLVTRMTQADAYTVENAYDVHGDLRKVTDQLGRITTNSYDKMGRVTQVAHAGGLIESFTYDELGRQTERWTNQGAYIGHSFTQSGNNIYLNGTGWTAGDQLKATTAYDIQGRVTQSVARGGDTTSYVYTWDAGISSGVGDAGGWSTATIFTNGRVRTDKSDLFGRQVYTNDLGGHFTNFTYDHAGRMSGSTGASLQTFTWFDTGHLASHANDAKTASYAYDEGGLLRSERLLNGTTWLRAAIANYDALGRMTAWYDEGTGSTGNAGSAYIPLASATWSYDANSNVVSTSKTFSPLGGDQSADASETHVEWFRYDMMNRLVLDRAKKVNGVLELGGTRKDITYDAAGQRKTVTSAFADTAQVLQPSGFTTTETFTNTRLETYDYSAAGHLISVNVGEGTYAAPNTPTTGPQRGVYAYDLLGNRTYARDISEATAAGNTSVQRQYEEHTVYNAKGQALGQLNYTVRDADTWRSKRTYEYGSGSAYALGQVTKETTQTQKNLDDWEGTETTTAYAWYDGAVASSVSYDSDTTDGSNALHTTTHTRDSSGDLTSSNINDGRPRTVNFTNDVSGQVIDRTEVSPAASEPREIRYRFGGREMGMTGNNGDIAQMDYAQAAADRTITPDTGANGAFRHGSTSDDRVADFNNSFDPINSYAQGSRAGTYMARGGETFSALAASLYGDSALWYKLAQANPAIGSPDVALSAGQTVRLPANVMRNSFNASTFAPYDPGEAIGDLSPTTPEPPKEGGQNCGVVGQILLTVVAVAVTAVTKNFALGAKIFKAGSTAAAVVTGASAGAAGSIASQGVGVATGIQDKFNWKAVGLAAISGGVGGGASAKFGGPVNLGQTLLQGSGINALTQGLGVATGLQGSFSWSGVAAAGIGAGAGTAFKNNIAVGTASALANAATRSALDGNNFGDNIIAAIPDVIGQALGNAVGSAANASIQARSVKAQLRSIAIDQGLTKAQADQIANLPKALLAAGEGPEGLGSSNDLEEFAAFVQLHDAKIRASGRVSHSHETFMKNVTALLISADVYNDVSNARQLPGDVRRLYGSEISELGLDPSRLVDDSIGYYSAIYRDTSNGGNRLFYANRGTNFKSLVDWAANGRNGLGIDSPQHRRAIENAITLNDSYRGEIVFTGHSLGGGLASAQAIVTGRRAITINAAGLHENTVSRYGFDLSQANALIDAFVVKGEILDATVNGRVLPTLGIGSSRSPNLVGKRHELEALNLSFLKGDSGVSIHGKQYPQVLPEFTKSNVNLGNPLLLAADGGVNLHAVKFGVAGLVSSQLGLQVGREHGLITNAPYNYGQ